MFLRAAASAECFSGSRGIVGAERGGGECRGWPRYSTASALNRESCAPCSRCCCSSRRTCWMLCSGVGCCSGGRARSFDDSVAHDTPHLKVGLVRGGRALDVFVVQLLCGE